MDPANLHLFVEKYSGNDNMFVLGAVYMEKGWPAFRASPPNGLTKNLHLYGTGWPACRASLDINITLRHFSHDNLFWRTREILVYYQDGCCVQ